MRSRLAIQFAGSVAAAVVAAAAAAAEGAAAAVVAEPAAAELAAAGLAAAGLAADTCPPKRREQQAGSEQTEADYHSNWTFPDSYPSCYKYRCRSSPLQDRYHCRTVPTCCPPCSIPPEAFLDRPYWGAKTSPETRRWDPSSWGGTGARRIRLELLGAALGPLCRVAVRSLVRFRYSDRPVAGAGGAGTPFSLSYLLLLRTDI